MRYGKKSHDDKKAYCDFPFDQTLPKPKPDDLPLSSPRAAQMEDALTNWYIPVSKRKEWHSLVGNVTGSELTRDIPNLNHVEIDNSIASPSSCRLNTESNMNATLKVVGFNAERGKNWVEFAKMSRQWNPDVIILNEMDIGMARTSNVHTARRIGSTMALV